MVTGVCGDLDCVVRHVVVGYGTILECVIIPNLHVEENGVKVITFLIPLIAMWIAVHVRY